MNPPTQDDFDALQREVDTLKNQVKELSEKVASFTSNTSLPIELEHALVDRGFIRFEPVGYPILNGDTVLFQVPDEGFRITISGQAAPAIPFRYVKLPKNVQGITGDMYIPLYIFADTTAD